MLITSTGQMMMEEAGGDTSGDGGVTSSLLRASKYAFKWSEQGDAQDEFVHH